ncbi:MAG: DUF2285 domain-containing protein [Hyphomicrobiales bacterium]|nr:DUF2285 domain-containing protein [Hyphomicrobiales bacterium]MCP5073602.1 DUF2285 domain-containing protein [Paracoccaceae bacterium]
MAMPAFDYLEEPPLSQDLTDYDRGHFKLYLMLLNAAAADVDWREVVTALFGIDPEQEPQRARNVYDQHLARAKWMTTTGFRHLL